MSATTSSRESTPHEHQLVTKLVNNPDLLALCRERKKYRTRLVGVIVATFLVYLISWAFVPGIINTRIPESGSINIGIWFSFAIIILNIILSGYYALVVGKKMDQLTQKLLDKEMD